MDRQITRRDLLSGAAMGAGLVFLGDSAAGQKPPATTGAADTARPAGTPQPAPASAASQSGDRLRLAMAHAMPAVGDVAANWATFEGLARQAAAQHADLCMSPECFLDGYAASQATWRRNQVVEIGRTCANEYLPKAKALAKELNMMLLVGMTYTAEPKTWNSAFLIGSDGSEIGRYDKNHLLDHDTKFDPGMDLPVFQTPFGLVGIIICADRRWPEAPRVLRVKGARVILNPTYGMRGPQNDQWMCTRSYENECYCCFAHPAESVIYDPRGNLMVRNPSSPQSREPGILVAELDLSRMPTKMFDARRPELYTVLGEPKPAAAPGRRG